MDPEHSAPRLTVRQVADRLRVIYNDRSRPTPTINEAALQVGVSSAMVSKARQDMRSRGEDVPDARRRKVEHPPSAQLADQLHRDFAGKQLTGSHSVLGKRYGYAPASVREAKRILREERGVLNDDGFVDATGVPSEEVAEADHARIAAILEDRCRKLATGTPLETHEALAQEFRVDVTVIHNAVLTMAAHDAVVLQTMGSPTVWGGPGPKPRLTKTEQIFLQLRWEYSDREAYPPGTQLAGVSKLASQFRSSPRVIQDVQAMLETLGIIERRGASRRAIIPGGPPLPYEDTRVVQIADALERLYKLNPDQWTPGTPIGSLSDHMRQFDASEATIIAVREELERRGVIYRPGFPDQPVIAARPEGPGKA